MLLNRWIYVKAVNGCKCIELPAIKFELEFGKLINARRDSPSVVPTSSDRRGTAGSA